MGILNLFRYAAKYTLTTALIGWITYSCHERIDRFVNTAKFYFSESEPNFVPKDHAFDLGFIYERNGKGNLETYLKNYTSRLPVFIRDNGVMVGSADYNFSNFTSGERVRVCSGVVGMSSPHTKSNTGVVDHKKRIAKTLLDLVGD